MTWRGGDTQRQRLPWWDHEGEVAAVGKAGAGTALQPPPPSPLRGGTQKSWGGRWSGPQPSVLDSRAGPKVFPEGVPEGVCLMAPTPL